MIYHLYAKGPLFKGATLTFGLFTPGLQEGFVGNARTKGLELDYKIGKTTFKAYNGNLHEKVADLSSVWSDAFRRHVGIGGTSNMSAQAREARHPASRSKGFKHGVLPWSMLLRIRHLRDSAITICILRQLTGTAIWASSPSTFASSEQGLRCRCSPQRLFYKPYLQLLRKVIGRLRLSAHPYTKSKGFQRM